MAPTMEFLTCCGCLAYCAVLYCAEPCRFTADTARSLGVLLTLSSVLLGASDDIKGAIASIFFAVPILKHKFVWMGGIPAGE